MKIMRIGIDLAKHVFQIHGVDAAEKVVCQRQLRRHQMAGFFHKIEPCLIGLEACASAHYWARLLQNMGHTVKLIAPQFVKPYVKTNKNDANDAAAICEALSRAHMRFVPVKTVEQQDLQALHRVRTELVHQRTAKVNQTRGLLAEYGVIVPPSVQQLRKALPELLEDSCNSLTVRFRQLLAGLQQDLRYLDERISQLDYAIQREATENPAARKLQQLRGIGPITATALVAAIGDARVFKKGRDLAAWLGLVPRQHSSGGKERLLGISKRGDSYLRMLLIHGARAVIKTASDKKDRLSQWIQLLCQRRNKNIAAVALANKTARLVWALLVRDNNYDPDYRVHTQPPTDLVGSGMSA